ncbi:MAG: biotin transporter BioY [Defluviitaleaceae bacterium]|nr:biotin transporter BioY [Defluviitaleaceae bacterium]
MGRPALSVKTLCRMGLLVAIIAVCAQISIPMPWGVPMTLQTLAISFAGMLLGAKKGTVAVLVYILLGAIGAPVFANFGGGVAVIFGRTGGFILSFPLLAFAAGIGAGSPLRGAMQSKVWLAGWLAAGAAVNYACGALMFAFVTGTPIPAAISLVVTPFLLATVAEIAALVAFGAKIIKALQREGAGHGYGIT